MTILDTGLVPSVVPYDICMTRETLCFYKNKNVGLVKIQIQYISATFYIYWLIPDCKQHINIWPVLLLLITDEFADQSSVYMSCNINVLIIWWRTEVDEQSPLWQ